VYVKRWLKTQKNNDKIHDMLWVPFNCQDWIDSHVSRDTVAFEWGSGSSTLYFSKRINHLTSIEHNKEWYSKVSGALSDSSIKNCNYRLIEPEVADEKTKKENNTRYLSLEKGKENLTFKKYCQSIRDYHDNYFDFISIDGRARTSCFAEAIDKLKHGGIMMLDDSQRTRYRECFLQTKKWQKINFFGFGPFASELWQTTIFIKP
jgi:hypothetical protein